MERSPQRRRLSKSVVLGGVFFCAYLAYQAVFAASCLLAGRGCVLTWSMYSGLGNNPEVFVVWKAGGETRLDEDEGIHGVGRMLGPKWDRARYAPPYVCEHFPEAQAARLEYRHGSGRTIPCNR
jgi:hypothetical protein